ncbi:hypothetical protein GYH30_020469 [Glycine max]|nr:hypothetical protein GYH30_020469 [Glycine max]
MLPLLPSHQLSIRKYFTPGRTKLSIFREFIQRLGSPYNYMLFFDDDYNNIPGWQSQASSSILVTNGVYLGAFREGLTKFSQNRNASKKNKQKRPN